MILSGVKVTEKRETECFVTAIGPTLRMLPNFFVTYIKVYLEPTFPYFQTMAQILGGLTGFVHHVCTTQESVILEYIHSLPSSILHIIKKTFVHCKVSNGSV